MGPSTPSHRVDRDEAEARAVRRVVGAWITNDVLWALILVWTIRRHRSRQRERVTN